MKLSKEEQSIINELQGIPKIYYSKIAKLIHLIKIDFIIPQHNHDEDTER